MRAFGMRTAALALAASVTACGGGGEPVAQQSQTQAPTPTPTPTLPAVADDKATAKRALVTPADLGKPWIQPKKVNEAKKAEKGDLCPGQKNARTLAKARADENADLTEGGQAGAAIGSFGVRTYGFGEEQKWRDAVAAATKGCAKWKSLEKLYVTLDVVTPPQVAGADEVFAHIERIYAEAAHKTLYYVRHYYEARVGRVVVSFELAYIQPKTDPTGKNMAKSSALLAKQVAKARKAFAL